MKLSAQGIETLELAMARVSDELRRVQSMGAEPVWFGAVASFEAKQAGQTWASEGAKSGPKWPSLTEGDYNAEQYVAWKRRNWPGRKINVWRGDTRDSFRFLGNKDHIARTSGRFMEFGSRAKLAKQMHEGQSYSTPKIAWLRERTPYKPKGSKGRGRNWFKLVLRDVPPRPLARKSPTQARHLNDQIAKVLLLECARVSGGGGNAFSRGLAKYAGGVRPDPRA